MNFDDFIPWFTVLVILSYMPFLIRMDLKNREIPHNTWIGMLPMFIVTGYLYATGYYPLECMAVSFGAVLMYFIAMKYGMFEGADFILLAFISLFYVVNPISGHVLTPIAVCVWLLAAWVIVNFTAYATKQEIKEFPMIPVISGAFIMAVILG